MHGRAVRRDHTTARRPCGPLQRKTNGLDGTGPYQSEHCQPQPQKTNVRRLTNNTQHSISKIQTIIHYTQMPTPKTLYLLTHVLITVMFSLNWVLNDGNIILQQRSFHSFQLLLLILSLYHRDIIIFFFFFSLLFVCGWNAKREEEEGKKKYI